jgi:Tol biopolymer transport system component/tRNA A-37 threonylcarbamoyl transferase component Bud32
VIGRRLAHYEIVAPLGHGGMGVVYKARDTRLDRHVAVKLLPPDSVANPEARARFVREAKTASALNHPGIVTIHDIQTSDDGSDFIVMELVEGRTLSDVIATGELRGPALLGLAVQIADAVAAAHAAGIVHRDVKPSNVMITRDGRAKVLDFGLAKLLEKADAADGTVTALPVTMHGVVLGTPAYMSPEQVEGRTLDARSDIFSFGAVLYEMTTGTRPFAGDSAAAVAARIIGSDPAAPSTRARRVPAALDAIILRCLRKDPARRFQTMADLKVALEDVAGEGARPASRARWLLIAAPAVIILAAAVWYATRSSESPAPPLRAVPLTTLPGAELYPSFSPDGDRIAFTWVGAKQENTDIYVQQIGAGTPLRLTTDARSEFNPVWSRDGRSIAFLRGELARPLARSTRELRVIPPLGGPERQIATLDVRELTVNVAFLAWCPDSRCLIATNRTGDDTPDALFVIPIDGSAPRPLTRPMAPVQADTNPVLSPDGHSLLFMRRTSWGSGEPFILRVKSDMTPDGEPTRVRVDGVLPDGAAWMPDARELVLSTHAFADNAQLWRVPAGGGTATAMEYIGDDAILPAIFTGTANVPPRLAYVRSFVDDNIWRLDVNDTGNAGVPAVAIASTKSDIHPAVSPDGLRVAFTSTRSGAWEIWTSAPDGGNAVQVTSMGESSGTGAPRWSPDGRTLAFASDSSGQFEIYLVAADGGAARALTNDAGFDHLPAFSPDGRWIYFCSDRTRTFEIWKVAAGGGAAVQVTHGGGFATQVAANGDLYYTQTAALGIEIPVWLLPASGGAPRKIADHVLNGVFTLTDRGIYYVSNLADQRIEHVDVASGRATTIARGLGLATIAGGFSASANGRMFFYTRRDAAVDDLMLVNGVR